MTVVDFCNKYGVATSSFYVSRRAGQFPKNVCYTKKGDDLLYVNEEYFLRRQKFKEDVIQFNQDLYYLLSEHMSDTNISRLVSVTGKVKLLSCNTFLSDGLWTIGRTSIMSTKVSNANWNMYRVGNWLLNRISRIKRKKIDVEFILDKRMPA
jgi:hypothetical protein